MFYNEEILLKGDVYMYSVEQLANNIGHRRFMEILVDLGVGQANMDRYANFISNKDGMILYQNWLVDNDERLSKKFGQPPTDQAGTVSLAVFIINEFIAWLDEQHAKLGGVL
jgi:hypothetical protein